MTGMHTNATVNDPHDGCSVHDPCDEGKPETCPLEPVRKKREEKKRGFKSALVVKKEPGGLRHYLDGKPVHCGELLLLQHFMMFSDDHGDYSVPDMNSGPTEVRYEASQGGGEIEATLYADIGGHEFVCRLEPWHRFSWPRRGLDRGY